MFELGVCPRIYSAIIGKPNAVLTMVTASPRRHRGLRNRLEDLDGWSLDMSATSITSGHWICALSTMSTLADP